MSTESEYITWIANYCAKEEQSNILLEEAHFSCKEHLYAAGKECPPQREFLLGLQSFLQTSVIKKSVDGVRKSYISGYKLQDKPKSIPIEFSVNSFFKLIPDGTGFRFNSEENTITFIFKSEARIDERFIVKEVSFQKDGLWTLKIDDKRVNLTNIGIGNTYSLTVEGISTVCRIATRIRVCLGKKIGYVPSVVNLKVCKVSYTEESMRTVKSQKCVMVVAFSCLSECCAVCSQATPYRKKQASQRKEMSVEELQTNLKLWIPTLSPTSLELILTQYTNHRGHQNNWTDYQSTLRWCLQLWIRSKRSYTDLQKTTGLCLPSESTLRRQKNSITQDPGIQEDQVAWMKEQAERMKLSEYARTGGLLIDEMAIQPDLKLYRRGKHLEFTGFTDCGREGNATQEVRQGYLGKPIADHVLQVTFSGMTSFVFPVAYYPTVQATAVQLHSILWNIVKILQVYGFGIRYISLDGAQSNRTLMQKCLRHGDAARMIGRCRGLPDVIFIMDISHVLKKIRNGLLKSSVKGSTRCLRLPSGQLILWSMFRNAYLWDKGNPMAIHRHLTDDHIFNVISNNSLKMRNHLAEDVLDFEMLHLMEAFKTTLGRESHTFDGVIELLKNTSTLINIFRSTKAITDPTDDRVISLKKVLLWFDNWENDIMQDLSMNQKEKEKCLLSSQCREDIRSCLIGFIELCQQNSKIFPGRTIVPSNINSDCIENQFCQQRALHHGANSNPTVMSYAKSINDMVLLQPLLSRKGNAARSREFGAATPFQRSNKDHTSHP